MDFIVGPEDFVAVDYWVDVTSGQLADAMPLGPDVVVDEDGTVYIWLC